MTRVNLGCGISKQEGYLNIDIDPKCNPDKIANITNLDFIEDESVELVETYHTIEHLWLEEVPKFFKEMKRIIKKGGKLIIECPDLEKCFSNMKKFPDRLEIGINGIFGNADRKIIDQYYDSYVNALHKTGFTKDIFKKYLEENGFKVIKFYDSIKYHGFPQRDTGVEAVKL